MDAKKILFIAQEITPYLPESEIATICRNLPQGIQERGREIRTFMPKFGNINERRNQLHEVIRLSGMNLIIDDTDHPLIIKVASIQSARMQVYFIDNEDFFQRKSTVSDENGNEYEDNDDRSIFYVRGVLETVKKLGNLNLNRAQTKSTMLFFVVDVCSEGKRLSRNYYFTNYEVRRGVIMSMPRTEITMKRDGRQITVTNVGKLPAIGVYVESPGYAHEFIASKNYLWLDPGESQIIEVNVDYPVCVKGWNIN